MRGLRWLIQKARAGDTVVIYYAGHGTYLLDAKSRVKDEIDQYDEAICPADVLSRGPILDDQIHDALARIRAGNITVLFDSCHSGTATKLVGDPRLNDPLALAGIRNRRLDLDLSRTRPFPVSFARGGPPSRPRTAGVAKRVDDAPSEKIVFLGGCQPWEEAQDVSPPIPTGRGAAYHGGLFTSLLYLTIQQMGIDTSWRNLMKEVRRRALLETPLQEPYADGPIDHAPFRTVRGKPGRAPRPQAPGKLAIRIVTAVAQEPQVDAQSQEAQQLQREVVASVRKALGDLPVQIGDAGVNELALLRRPDDYRVWVSAMDGRQFHTPNQNTFDEAVQYLAAGARLLYNLWAAAKLTNPAGTLHPRLTVHGGPSAVVPTGGMVRGHFTVGQPCTVQLLRVDAAGRITLLGDARACRPGQPYPFRHPAGNGQGKQMIKLIATRKPVDWSGAAGAADLRQYLNGRSADDARQWDEDQETLYVGNWARIYGASVDRSPARAVVRSR